MTLKKGQMVERGYATVADDEGINYREIADIMTEIGFPMNHSSARNYVIRVMKKFVSSFAKAHGISVPESKIDDIAKSPNFQAGIADLLHVIELDRRAKRKV